MQICKNQLIQEIRYLQNMQRDAVCRLGINLLSKTCNQLENRKMREAFAVQKLLTFFQQKIMAYFRY